MKKNHIAELIAFLFIVVFLYAGGCKLYDFSVFKEVIGESPLLKPFAVWIAWAILFVEAIIAVLLLVPAWRLKGLYASLGLMVVFTGYIVAIFCFDEFLPCACGSIIQHLSWKGQLLLNIVLILLAIGGIRAERATRNLRPPADPYTKTILQNN